MRPRALIAFVAVMALVGAVSVLPAAAQYTLDPNTVLLDSFDGTTQGEEHGTVGYAPSLPGLGQAVDLETGDWIKWAVSSWAEKQGTIEAWIYPDTYISRVAVLQWGNTNTSPSSGYIGTIGINADGHLRWKSWGAPWCSSVPIGSSVIPLQEWTHVAATWSSTGTRLYVNGVLDAFSTSNCAPALSNPTYVYINGWGDGDFGLMDELRISNVARSEEEISSYVVEILNPLESKDDCKKGGWQEFTDHDGVPFKNQGDCVSYVATAVQPGMVGNWEAIDGIPGNPEHPEWTADFSRMILNISGARNGAVNVFFKDFGATSCDPDPESGELLYAGQLKARGVVDGNVLTVYFRGGPGVGNGTIWCMAQPPFMLWEPNVGDETFSVTYDPVDDTLFDGFSLYYRVKNN